jgi:hypothetical protein
MARSVGREVKGCLTSSPGRRSVGTHAAAAAEADFMIAAPTAGSSAHPRQSRPLRLAGGKAGSGCPRGAAGGRVGGLPRCLVGFAQGSGHSSARASRDGMARSIGGKAKGRTAQFVDDARARTGRIREPTLAAPCAREAGASLAPGSERQEQPGFADASERRAACGPSSASSGLVGLAQGGDRFEAGAQAMLRTPAAVAATPEHRTFEPA